MAFTWVWMISSFRPMCRAVTARKPPNFLNSGEGRISLTSMLISRSQSRVKNCSRGLL